MPRVDFKLYLITDRKLAAARGLAAAILGGEGTKLNLQKEALELTPGSYGGVISLERLVLPPDICARIGSKRALSYDGVVLLTGSIVDPRYDGHLPFGLYNASQRWVLIRHGRKICNIVFERLFEAPEKQTPAIPTSVAVTFQTHSSIAWRTWKCCRGCRSANESSKLSR